ncbi:MAG: hypothetical protein ACI3XI_04740 [Eubacteriales bacterium]
MKKHILRSLSLVLVLMMLAPCFASCDTAPKMEKMTEAERTDKIFEIVGSDSFADSYTTDLKIEMEGTTAGSSFTMTGTGFSTYTGLRSESPERHDEAGAEVVINANGTDITQKTEIVEGYRDGKMYRSYKENGENTALVSPIFIEDYEKHRTIMYDGLTDEDLTEAFKKATSKTCVQLEDGGWTATASGYDADSLAVILKILGSGAEDLCEGYKISDTSITVTVTEQLIPVSMEFAFSFERTDFDDLYRTPKLKMIFTYRDIDTAVLPEVDFSKYTEVEDLAAYLEVQKILGDLKTADGIKFTTVIEQNISFAGTTQNIKETDIVTSSTDEDGKYSFSITSKVNNGTEGDTVVTIDYKDGAMTTIVSGSENQTQEITDSTARTYIGTFLDPLVLTSVYPSEIKTGEGDYTHTFVISNPILISFKEVYGQLGATNMKGKAEADVVYENGTVTKLYCIISFTAKIEGQTLIHKVSYTVTIEE